MGIAHVARPLQTDLGGLQGSPAGAEGVCEQADRAAARRERPVNDDVDSGYREPLSSSSAALQRRRGDLEAFMEQASGGAHTRRSPTTSTRSRRRRSRPARSITRASPPTRPDQSISASGGGQKRLRAISSRCRATSSARRPSTSTRPSAASCSRPRNAPTASRAPARRSSRPAASPSSAATSPARRRRRPSRPSR